MIHRVTIHADHLDIELAEGVGDGQFPLQVQWTQPPRKPRREVVPPAEGTHDDVRPIRSDSRARLLQAIALGRSWLQELTNGKVKDTDAIATREDRSKRSVHMMISLAFVAPDIVEAAINCRLPRGIGISRLIDLPPNWSQQRAMLGLAPRV